MERLLQVLQQQLEYCEALRDLAVQKQKALVQADVDRVSELVKGEETMVLQLAKLEKQRQNTIEQLALEHSWPQQTLSLASIREQSGQLFADEFETVESQMVAVAEKFKAVNRQNKELIDQSLRMVNYNIQLLSGNQFDSAPAYGRAGQTNQAATSRTLLDHKA